MRIVISPDLVKGISAAVDKNFDAQVKFLGRLVKAPSANPFTPEDDDVNTPIELETANLIFKKLMTVGLSPKKMGASTKRPNIVCHVGPKRFRKSLILNGHMDTVIPGGKSKLDPYSGSVRRGRLYGLGALDMKGSLTAYIYAIKAIKDMGVNLDGRLTLAFVVDEESGACSQWGTRFLINKGIKAKAAIVGEPGDKTIAIGHRGGYRFKLTTYGEGIHTGLSLWEKKKKGKNAIVDMMEVVRLLQKLEIPFKPAKVFPGRKPVFTFPTRIDGGRSVNEVPDICTAYGDVRLMPGNSSSQVKIWIKDKLAKKSEIKYEVEDLLFVPAVEIDAKEDIVTLLAQNAQAVLGEKPQIRGVGPWNCAWMYITRDIPCIGGFGPCGENPHQPDEWVSLDSLREITKIYAQTVVDYLGTRQLEKGAE